MTLPHELPKVVTELQSHRHQSVRKLRAIANDFIQGITEQAISTFHFLPLQTHLLSSLPLPPPEPSQPIPPSASAPTTRSRPSKRDAPTAGLQDHHARPTRRTRHATQSKVLQKAIVSDKENTDLPRAAKGKRMRTRRAPRPPLKPVPVNSDTANQETRVPRDSKHHQPEDAVAPANMSAEASLEEIQTEEGPKIDEKTEQEREETNGNKVEEQTCIADKEEDNKVADKPAPSKKQKGKRRVRTERGRKRRRNGVEVVKCEHAEAAGLAENSVTEVPDVAGQPHANEKSSCDAEDKLEVEEGAPSQAESQPSLDARDPGSLPKDLHQAHSNQDLSDDESPIIKRRQRRGVKRNQDREATVSSASSGFDENIAPDDNHSFPEKVTPPSKVKGGAAEVDQDESSGDNHADSVDDIAEALKGLPEEQGKTESGQSDTKTPSTDSSAADLKASSPSPAPTEEPTSAESRACDPHADSYRPDIIPDDKKEEENRNGQPSIVASKKQDLDEGSVSNSTLSPKLQQSDARYRTEPEVFPMSTLFTVGKDGMIGQATVGALSQLASTPATGCREQVEEETGVEASNHRSTRLFNPKTSIYPSSRKPPLLCTKKAVSSTAKTIQAPLKIDANPSVSEGVPSQPAARIRKHISFKESVSCDPQSHKSATEEPDISRPIDVEVPGGDEYQVSSIEPEEEESEDLTSPRKRQTCGESSTSSALLNVRGSVAFNTQPSDVRSPSRDSTRIKSLFKEGPYPSFRMNNPKTAPGQRAFPPRTDKKLTKSAYRQRIERLHADAHASGIISGNTQNLAESDPYPSESKTSYEVMKADKAFVPSAAQKAPEPSPDNENKGSEELRDGSLRDSGPPQMPVLEEQKNITTNTKESESPRLCVTTRHVSSNASSTTSTERCGNDKANRVEEHLQKEQPPSLDRITRHSFERPVLPQSAEKQTNEDNLEIEELNPTRPSNALIATNTSTRDQPRTSLEQPDTDTDGKTASPFVAVPGNSSDNPDVADTTPTPLPSEAGPVQNDNFSDALDTAESSQPVESEQRTTDVSAAKTFTNLVSSVASFLPVSSSLFGAQAESKAGEKSAEDQAKLAAKRQKLDAERREAELVAKREAMRLARQKEGQERQKKAESRRRLLAEMEKHREEEKRKKEALRQKKRREEEERQRLKKEEDDRRKEEHRRRVLEQKQKRMMAAKQGVRDGQHQTKLRRPGFASARQGQVHASKCKTQVSDALPPKTPTNNRSARVEEEPQWELTGERKRGISENSEEERDRRRKKKIPQWAASNQVWMSLTNESSDPDTVFARGAPSCNLENVFHGTEGKRKFRPRDDSGDWTKDRLTAKEEMEYKRKAGFFDNA